MLSDRTPTYISLFSSAGVGCYGFKQAGFECIATSEIIPRRIKVQEYNNKCRFDSGYICGDISTQEVKDKIFDEIARWQEVGNDRVDVLIATPPCQGMSVANHKKTATEIIRNSLVVESIHLIHKVTPRFFIFENVPLFMKTGCTAPDGSIKEIGTVIYEELSDEYVIADRVLNFKNYGSNSSRTRTLVIGVHRSIAEYIAPIELYPSYQKESTLQEIIGHLPSLEWGEISDDDIYHAFRVYPEEMRAWIHDLKEGECAFDNVDIHKRPHRLENGEIVINTRKNGDKYTRQSWSKVAPCIHTRNDQLASQNTIHPRDDRVFSIRELMLIMTIPFSFRWTEYSFDEMNAFPDKVKREILKKEEIKIRQSIGEAVPTQVFNKIARSISSFLHQEHLRSQDFSKFIAENSLDRHGILSSYIDDNPGNLCNASLARLAELSNAERENYAAFYTNKYILNEIYKELPNFDKEEIHILEPAVGIGNFIPFIIKKYEHIPSVNIDVVDIDGDMLDTLRVLIGKIDVPSNVSITYHNEDFLSMDLKDRYDLIIGNPPFSKLSPDDAQKYLVENHNKTTRNAFEFFLEKSMRHADHVVMITPKSLLNTPEFAETRSLLKDIRVSCIEDFGEYGFKGVLVETICVFIDTMRKPSITSVRSLTLKRHNRLKQAYIMDEAFPYWIIYRDEFFDAICQKMSFGVFSVFRDRQITNTNTCCSVDDTSAYIRVLKSRNISDDGTEIISIPGYDTYIRSDVAEKLSAFKYIGDTSVYLTPNMTYKPRVMRNVGTHIVNGSVAVLIPTSKIMLTDRQLSYFASDEYRKFYKIARNYQTRSLNIDASSVFFFGVLQEDM